MQKLPILSLGLLLRTANISYLAWQVFRLYFGFAKILAYRKLGSKPIKLEMIGPETLRPGQMLRVIRVTGSQTIT